DVLSRFNCRRLSAGTSTVSYLVACFAKRAPASLAAWLAWADRTSVSSVMKVCCTQAARLASIPSFRIVALTVSRNAFASAGVGADEDALCVQASASEQPAASTKYLKRID